MDGAVNPLGDIETINTELLLADMEVVEKRIERIKSGKKIKKEHVFELVVLEKCLEALENEKSIAQLELDEEEKMVLKNFGFLTEKPILLVINMDEQQYKTRSYPGQEQVVAYAAQPTCLAWRFAAESKWKSASYPLKTENCLWLIWISMNPVSIAWPGPPMITWGLFLFSQ
ncbi:MAG: hypothetical protein RQM92_10535 [Candidatus Syntrophopropionicum ammoniitolerans]